jgi:LAO/AO transport system kinase
MEIADIFVINKADRDGALGLANEVEAMLSMRQADDGWDIPVLLTTAIKGEGVEELVESIGRHTEFLNKSNLLEKRRHERIRKRIRDIVNQRIESILWENEEITKLVEEYLTGSEDGPQTPYTLAELVVKKLGIG